MAKQIDGITMIQNKDYMVCHIIDFSLELQAIIRDRLSSVCHGASAASSGSIMYNYQSTLKEFLDRYESKPPHTKTGMIGELLIHIIISEYLSDYYVVSPFFNLEEKSIRKGFDVVLSHRKDYSIWITEVKSGGLHKGKSSDETVHDLLHTAKRDLNARLNENRTSLWMNAVNAAKSTFDGSNDLKDAIIKILSEHGDDSAQNRSDSKNNSVILVSVLFASLIDSMSDSQIRTEQLQIHSESLFKQTIVLSIQKATSQKVYDFIKGECSA